MVLLLVIAALDGLRTGTKLTLALALTGLLFVWVPRIVRRMQVVRVFSYSYLVLLAALNSCELQQRSLYHSGVPVDQISNVSSLRPTMLFLVILVVGAVSAALLPMLQVIIAVFLWIAKPVLLAGTAVGSGALLYNCVFVQWLLTSAMVIAAPVALWIGPHVLCCVMRQLALHSSNVRYKGVVRRLCNWFPTWMALLLSFSLGTLSLMTNSMPVIGTFGYLQLGALIAVVYFLAVIVPMTMKHSHCACVIVRMTVSFLIAALMTWFCPSVVCCLSKEVTPVSVLSAAVLVFALSNKDVDVVSSVVSGVALLTALYWSGVADAAKLTTAFLIAVVVAAETHARYRLTTSLPVHTMSIALALTTQCPSIAIVPIAAAVNVLQQQGEQALESPQTVDKVVAHIAWIQTPGSKLWLVVRESDLSREWQSWTQSSLPWLQRSKSANWLFVLHNDDRRLLPSHLSSLQVRQVLHCVQGGAGAIRYMREVELPAPKGDRNEQKHQSTKVGITLPTGERDCAHLRSADLDTLFGTWLSNQCGMRLSHGQQLWIYLVNGQRKLFDRRIADKSTLR